MKRVIKEQETTQNETLSLLLRDCGWKGYTLVTDENEKRPALRQSVPGKGIVFLYDDFTYKAYGLDKKLNNQGTYTACEAVKGKIDAPLGPDQKKVVDAILAQNTGYKRLSDIPGGRGEIDKGTYKAVDLNSINAQTFPKPGVHFIYQSVGITNDWIDQMPNIKQFFTKLGYTFTEAAYGTPEFDSGKNALAILQNNGGQDLVSEFNTVLQKNGKSSKTLKVWPTTTQATKGAGKNAAKNLKDILKSQQIDRQGCRAAVKELYKSASKNLPPSAGADAVEPLKELVYKCATQGKNFLSGVLGIEDELNFLKRNNGPYGIRYKFEQRMNESKDDVLKSIIKGKLSMLSESKKKTLVTESKIINARFKMITESSKVKKESVSELFNESFDLVNLGLSPKLISEGLWDSLKGMFGLGTEGILGYFKEKIAETLLNKLGINTDSWVAGTIVKAIGNIPLGDYTSGKILTCDYLTPLLAKSIAEEALDKVKDNAGLTGGFYDVLRNSIIQGLDSSDFAQSIERGLAAAICPALSKISGNMDGVFNTLKTKALS